MAAGRAEYFTNPARNAAQISGALGDIVGLFDGSKAQAEGRSQYKFEFDRVNDLVKQTASELYADFGKFSDGLNTGIWQDKHKAWLHETGLSPDKLTDVDTKKHLFDVYTNGVLGNVRSQLSPYIDKYPGTGTPLSDMEAKIPDLFKVQVDATSSKVEQTVSFPGGQKKVTADVIYNLDTGEPVTKGPMVFSGSTTASSPDTLAAAALGAGDRSDKAGRTLIHQYAQAVASNSAKAQDVLPRAADNIRRMTNPELKKAAIAETKMYIIPGLVEEATIQAQLQQNTLDLDRMFDQFLVKDADGVVTGVNYNPDNFGHARALQAAELYVSNAEQGITNSLDISKNKFIATLTPLSLFDNSAEVKGFADNLYGEHKAVTDNKIKGYKNLIAFIKNNDPTKFEAERNKIHAEKVEGAVRIEKANSDLIFEQTTPEAEKQVIRQANLYKAKGELGINRMIAQALGVGTASLRARTKLLNETLLSYSRNPTSSSEDTVKSVARSTLMDIDQNIAALISLGSLSTNDPRRQQAVSKSMILYMELSKSREGLPELFSGGGGTKPPAAASEINKYVDLLGATLSKLMSGDIKKDTATLNKASAGYHRRIQAYEMGLEKVYAGIKEDEQLKKLGINMEDLVSNTAGDSTPEQLVKSRARLAPLLEFSNLRNLPGGR